MDSQKDIPDGFELSEIVVIKTTNYDLICFPTENRQTNVNILRKLNRSVERWGWLGAYYPILLTMDLRVIDGQHRHRYAKEHTLPLYAIRTDLLEPEASADVSEVPEAWKPHDRLHYWAALGKKDYLILLNFWKDHRLLSLPETARLCSSEGVRNSRFQERFNHGQYKADNLEFAQKVYSMVEDFGKWIPHHRERSFLAVTRLLAKNPKYDHARMMENMETQYFKLLPKQVDVDQYFQVINKVYNFKEHKRILLDPKFKE